MRSAVTNAAYVLKYDYFLCRLKYMAYESKPHETSNPSTNFGQKYS